MSQNLSISISSGSSSGSTFVIPTSTPEGNYAFCITLAKVIILLMLPILQLMYTLYKYI